MQKQEKWMLIGALLMAFVGVEWLLFGGLGVSVVICATMYFIWRLLAIRLIGSKVNNRSYLWFIPIVLCTLCFVLFSNPVLKVLNILFLIGLIVVQDIQLFIRTDKEFFSIEGVIEVLNLGVHLPFDYMNMPKEWLKASAGDEKKEWFQAVGKVFLGLLIAVPFIGILIILLASADAAFNGMLEFIFEHINLRWTELIIKLPLMLFSFFFFISYFYGLQHKKEKEGVMRKEESSTKPCLDFIVVGTVATLFCLVYVVFCFSQLAYFISAFSGILPSDFTYAEYARRGFFETLPLTLFNLAMLSILSYMSKWVEGNKKRYVKGMMGFITGFTLFLVVCALSKMGMYMQEYGLTLKRVYVAWFLSFIIVITLLIFIKLWYKKINLIKSIVIAFIVMYLGLNYLNVDYLVAKQNIYLYQSGKTETLSFCFYLSTSAMGPVIELINESPEPNENATNLMRDLKKQMEHKTWESWNLADYKANKLFIEHEMIK
ncbi:hypothetical protein CS063_11370 [Sporanaerobium hydrogeniformans]|uniref:Uncharacterized protein n=1 Tax=Sporanaerobium hydrogeniformans TaxID=3072179 RepID=A0AC61DAF2_9FIRM|nr:DUF4173 domain-containing protein [Sporanaerobium hydrogeniformans]PHV70261.1 hypothetical protein CS063_11370 [Sporanaerobium hydrogeniformans]